MIFGCFAVRCIAFLRKIFEYGIFFFCTLQIIFCGRKCACAAYIRRWRWGRLHAYVVRVSHPYRCELYVIINVTGKCARTNQKSNMLHMNEDSARTDEEAMDSSYRFGCLYQFYMIQQADECHTKKLSHSFTAE